MSILRKREWFRCRWAAFVPLLLVASLLSSSLAQAQEAVPEREYRFEWQIFHGIPAQVRAVVPASVDEADLRLRLEAIFAEVDGRYNAFNPESDLAKLNAADMEKVALSASVYPEFAALWQVASDVHHASGGAFDPSIWPLKTIWNAAAKKAKLPSESDLLSAAARVGMDKLRLVPPNSVKRPTYLALDFGGFVKGHAVDRLAVVLKATGAVGFLAQIGGEIRVFGRRLGGESWQVGVQHPLQMDAIYGVLDSQGLELAISTSGNYRQPIVIDGTSYYHIFNPRDGRPISTDVLGVTIVRVGGGEHANAFADAFATALSVLGRERGLELARSFSFEALFLVKEPSGPQGPHEYTTADWRRFFTAAK